MFHPVSPTAELSDDEEAADVFGNGMEGDAEGGVPADGSVEGGTEEVDDWDGALEAVDSAEKPKFQPGKRKQTMHMVDLVPVPGMEHLDGAQQPVALPDVKPPTQAEVDLHNLTHLPYRRWCRFCVAARRPNSPHLGLPPFSREIPLIVFDYCFLRNIQDQDLITVLCARLYPFRAVFAV